jgi:hypothetical protein
MSFDALSNGKRLLGWEKAGRSVFDGGQQECIGAFLCLGSHPAHSEELWSPVSGPALSAAVRMLRDDKKSTFKRELVFVSD